MDDGRSTREYRKKSRISGKEGWERDYWTGRWGISDRELTEAIEKTGSTDVEKLERYLINHRTT